MTISLAADGLPPATAVVKWVTLDRVSERRREDLDCVGSRRLSGLRGKQAEMGVGGKKGGQVFNKVQLGWGKIKKKNCKKAPGVLKPLSSNSTSAPPATRALPFAFPILQQQLYNFFFWPRTVVSFFLSEVK